MIHKITYHFGPANRLRKNKNNSFVVFIIRKASIELLNYDAWMILYCFDQYKAKESFNNSIIADFAYVVCILLVGLEFGAFTFILFPSNCCFCCDCNGPVPEDLDNGHKREGIPPVRAPPRYAPVASYEPTAPLLENEYEPQGHYEPQVQQPEVVIYQPSAYSAAVIS